MRTPQALLASLVAVLSVVGCAPQDQGDDGTYAVTVTRTYATGYSGARAEPRPVHSLGIAGDTALVTFADGAQCGLRIQGMDYSLGQFDHPPCLEDRGEPATGMEVSSSTVWLPGDGRTPYVDLYWSAPQTPVQATDRWTLARR